MPKGLLLLLLLLLIGGYYFFAHSGGGSTPYSLPSLLGSAKLVRGDGGYTLVFNGSMHLPMSVEYNIARLTASILVDGVPLKTQSLPTSVVKGPSDYPIAFSPTIPLSAHSVSVKIDGNVLSGGKNYGLSVEIPVALPDKSLLFKQPDLELSISDVRLMGSSKSVTVDVGIYNPNSADISVSGLKLSFAGATQDVSIDKVQKESWSHATVDFTVPSDVTTAVATLSGKYAIGGQTYSISRNFDVNIPVLPSAPPVVSVSAEYVGLTSSGYSVKFSGRVFNPNDFPLVLDSLKVVVSSDDVSQDVNLLSNATVLPDSNATFSKSATVLFVFSRATAKVVAHYGGADHILATFPVGVANPAKFISAPSISLNARYDSNASLCTFTPSITNNNSFALDLNAVVLSAGSVTKHYAVSSIGKGATQTLDAVEVNASSAVVATISGEYGIKAMGVWIPFTYSTELNCP